MLVGRAGNKVAGPLEHKCRQRMAQHALAFHGGGFVGRQRQPQHPHADGSSPAADEEALASVAGRDFTLTAFERESATRMRLEMKASAARSERVILEAARDAAAERERDFAGNHNDDDYAWTEFDGTSLEYLLTPDESLGGPPVRLLDARFLIKLADGGGWLRARQHLPDDAFISLPRLRRLRGAHTGLRILCCSHMWLQPDHPDPRRTTIELIVRALKVLLHEQGGTFGVFLDFASLCQSDDPISKPLLRQALVAQADLWSHPHTWVLKVTQLPRNYPRGFSFRPGAHPNLADYHERGWALCEAAMAGLVKVHKTQVLDLSLMDRAVAKYAEKKRDGMLDDDEAINELGHGVDQRTMLEVCTANRPPPKTPHQISAELEMSFFANRARDLGVTRHIYKRACLSRLKTATTLEYAHLQWGDDEARQLGRILATGWARECMRLHLAHNQIGDDGMHALAESLRKAKAVNIEYIDIRGNPASGAAKQAVRSAIDELLAAGKMTHREIEVRGAPDYHVRLIQLRVRKHLASMKSATAMLGVGRGVATTRRGSVSGGRFGARRGSFSRK